MSSLLLSSDEPLVAAPVAARETPLSGRISWRSRIGINAANFFLAEVVGVVIPFVGVVLKREGWSDGPILFAVSLAGLGLFLMQTPAGWLVDQSRRHRGLLASSSLALGVCYGLLPTMAGHAVWVGTLLFAPGVAQAFFAPLLGALALGLVGHAGLNRMIGANQGWNHAGNFAAAVMAMVLVSWLDAASVFVAVAGVSVLAAGSVFLIHAREYDPHRAKGFADAGHGDAGTNRAAGARQLLADRRILFLLVAVALFHLANAPVMPLVALYVKHLHGSNLQVAAVVLVAQIVMVPVAMLAGWLCNRWGRKPTFAVGFLVLPLRIVLYALADSPAELVALQALDGIGAGIYGVAVVAICADLTRTCGGFNTLSGMTATALAVGGVIGPLMAGTLVEFLGYGTAFFVFAGVAALAAAVFLAGVPETAPVRLQRLDPHAES